MTDPSDPDTWGPNPRSTYVIKLDLWRSHTHFTALGPGGRIGDFDVLFDALNAVNALAYPDRYELVRTIRAADGGHSIGHDDVYLTGGVYWLDLQQAEE